MKPYRYTSPFLFPSVVRTCRLLLGLTQEQFAAACGLAAKTIAKIERARCIPKARTIAKFNDTVADHGIVVTADEVGVRIQLAWEVLEATEESRP